MNDDFFALGIDVGGTKLEVCVLKFSGRDKFRELARLRTSTNRLSGYDSILENTTALIKASLKKSKLKAADISRCGVGLPGSVNPENGKMIFGNTLALKDENLARDLKSATGLKCNISTENDANCFALAEAFHGAGLQIAEKMKSNPAKLIGIGVILGTGVGGGIITYGNILRGRRGGAGEIGHTELHENGISCYCGRNGCAENYLSGPALEARFSRRPKEIFDLSAKGDPLARAIVLQYKKDLAKFLGGLVNIFDPHYFVLGGGMSNQAEIYVGLDKLLSENCFLLEGPPVLKNKLGDSAGVIGAVLLPFPGF